MHPATSRHRVPAVLLTLALALVGVVAVPAAAAPTHYVVASDGERIAVNVRLPEGHVEGRRYPAVLDISGYDGGSATGRTPLGQVGDAAGVEDVPLGDDSRAVITNRLEDTYVTVHASLRGTGCSSGRFDLFDWRGALDGRDVIEWMASQPWSNGDIGLIGHSYSGITAMMVAATRPESLRAVTASGLIDDLYRGIAYMGGVSNYGFPLLWTGAVRPAYDLGGGVLPGVVGADEQCLANQLGKGRTVAGDPVVQGLLQPMDGDWWRARSLVSVVDEIDVPVHITGAYQDEQTGPRGPAHLFERLPDVPRRLLLSNGVHATQIEPDEVFADRRAWLDHWVAGVDHGFGRGPGRGRRALHSSVTVLLETHAGPDGTERPNGRLEASTFPLERTSWTELYLRAGGRLSARAPSGPEPPDHYASSVAGRQSWSYQLGPAVGPPLTTAPAPDELAYATGPVRRDVAIVGPMTATLYLATTATDTDLFVQLVDEGPDGDRQYLQRGLLRASHRRVDPVASDRTPDGRIYRPHRPHTNPEPVEPGRIEEYVVEIFPVGHVLRDGHRLVLKIHDSPILDSFYAYLPGQVTTRLDDPATTAPAVNTVFHDANRRSRLLLPIVPLDGADLGPPLACGAQSGVRCVPAPGA